MGTFNARLLGADSETFENVTGAVIAGGLIAVPNATATSDPSLAGFGLAGDAAKNALGVTEHDTVPVSLRAAQENTTAVYDAGYNVTDLSVPGATTTVYNDVDGFVTYAAAVGHGAKLACAANGQVRAWVTADGADAEIGWCTQPGGVTAAGKGRARIRIH